MTALDYIDRQGWTVLGGCCEPKRLRLLREFTQIASDGFGGSEVERLGADGERSVQVYG